MVDQSYSGRISTYTKPSSAQARSTFKVTVTKAYVNSSPQQTLTVYAILKNANTDEQLNYVTRQVTANGNTFAMAAITADMPDISSQAYYLELWLYDPPNKSGWHLLERETFTVTRAAATTTPDNGDGVDQSYSGDIDAYDRPGHAQVGHAIKVTITKAHVRSSPQQTVDVYGILYLRDDRAENLDSTVKRVVASGTTFSMNPIGTEMPNKSVEYYTIELWLKDPPNKPGWHNLCKKTFKVQKGTQESGYTYGGRIRNHAAPDEVGGGKSFTVDISDAVFNANPLVTTDVYGILKNADGVQLGDQMVTVLGDGQGFSINGIPGEKDDSDRERFNLEMWLHNPPGKSGWHRLDDTSFVVNKKAKTLLPEIPFISDIIPPPF